MGWSCCEGWFMSFAFRRKQCSERSALVCATGDGPGTAVTLLDEHSSPRRELIAGYEPTTFG